MTLSKRPVKRGRGRPPGTKNKTTIKKSENQELLRKIQVLEGIIDELEDHLKNADHQEIGYRAVISYLQARLDGNAEL